MNIPFLPDQTLIDPNEFVLNWGTLFEVLALIIVLSFLVERMLAVVFESKPYEALHARRTAQGKGSHKATIAFIVSVLLCVLWQVDIMAVLMTNAHVSILGNIVTGGVIAGGSKASIKLFHDVLGVKSMVSPINAAAPPNPGPPEKD